MMGIPLARVGERVSGAWESGVEAEEKIMNIASVLQGIRNVKVGVLGDFCLDIYWHADMRKSELSRETPHFPLPIVEERIAPGGAGNVVANLCALKPARCVCLGVFGEDWRGTALMTELRKAGADVSGIVVTPGWQTNTYIKPLRKGLTNVVYEDPRLDFANYAPLPASAEERLLGNLEAAIPSLDVLCVCDQMAFGSVTDKVRDRIFALGAEGMKIVVDSRERCGLYRNCVVKPNDFEACRALSIPHTDEIECLREAAASLEHRTGRPSVITVGEKGCVICEAGKPTHIPTEKATGEIDICGAGDTFMASLAGALATGASLTDAASLGNLASSVTIRKLKQTGTASPEEILAAEKGTLR